MKTNKNGVKLLTLVAVFAMIAAAFVIIPDVSNATGETEEKTIDIETAYNNEKLDVKISNDDLGNVLESTATGITGYVSKITDNTLSGKITQTWSEAGKGKTYEYAMVFTINVDSGKYITFVGSDGNVKSVLSDGSLTLLKYINESNKNTSLVYAVTDGVQTTMPTTGLTTITINVELAETIDPTSTIFNNGGEIKLTKNYIFSKMCTITKDTVLTMDGYDIIFTGSDVFKVQGVSFTVNGDDDSTIIGSEDKGNDLTVIWGVDYEGKNPTITINGGTYIGEYTILVGYPNEGTCKGSLTINDALIYASAAGVWASYSGVENVTITDTIISSDGTGLYIGVVKETTLTNVTVNSIGTALEIKSGTVNVIGGSYSSEAYVKSIGDINMNGSGSGEDTICINNGYSRVGTGSAVSVTFTDDVEIINTNAAEPKPVQVVAGNKEAKVDGKVVVCPDPITVTGLSVSDVEIVKIKNGADITMNYSDIKSADVTTDVPPQKVESDTVLVLNATADNVAIKVDPRNELTIITGGNAISGTVSFTDGVETFSIQVTGLKGDVTFSKGSVIAKGNFEDGSITLADGDILKISGSILNDFTINGPTDAGKSATVIVQDEESLSIASGKTLSLTGNIKMNNDGQIYGGGTIDVPSTAQFYTSNPVSINFTGTGQIILEDATETLKLSDKLASSMTTEPTQKVIITGNLTIKENQYLEITGNLEVPEGVTVTIENGGLLRLKSPTATATIAGTIKSLGQYNETPGFYIDDTVTGDVIITGQVIAGKTTENQKSVSIKGYAYLEGTITVNAKTIAEFGNLQVSENGTVTVKGTITGELRNQGTVVIDGAVNSATIYNQATTAVVKIDDLTSGTLTVSDSGLYLQTIESARYYAGTYYTETSTIVNASWAPENAISFTNVEGITVTESIQYITDANGDRKAYNHMEVQGSVTISNVKEGTPANPVMTITKGTVDVIETLDISKAELVIGTGATLEVYGTINADDSDLPKEITDTNAGIGITVKGTLVVYGLVHCIDNPVGVDNGSIEAVTYEIKESTKTIYYYTNLADAIASGVKDLEVLGNLTILKDTTIPAGVEIDASGKNVYIGRDDVTDVTLTVADGGYLLFGSVDVVGTFVIENTDDGVNKMTQITSDTSVISENTAMYTNLLNALNNAESGEVRITKIGDVPVTLSSDATVKKDVTLIVPSSKTLSIVNGVTLTVDGILKLDGTLVDEKSVNDIDGKNGFYTKTALPERPNILYSVVKVNGTIISASPLTYGNGPVQSAGYKTSGYNIPGAQYELKTKYYLTTIEQAAPVIKTVDNSTVKIYGENKVGTVAFEGTAMMPATVEIYGNITAESFTIAFGDIKIKDIAGTNDIAVDGTFGSSVGSITVKNMKVVDTDLIITDTVVTIDDVEVQKVIIQGNVETNKATSASSLTFNGKVEISKNDFSVDATYNTDKYGNVTIAEDSTVTVSGTGNSLTVTGDKSKITVNGNLITTKSGSIDTTTLVVMGTLDIKEAQGSTPAGIINVTNLYIGGTTSDVATVTTAGAAAVNAPSNGVGVVYLFPGSTVTGILAVELESEDAVFTEFYVEDALWLTVYKISGTNTLKIAVMDGDDKKYNFKPLTLKEKEFTAWQYMSSGKLYNVAADKAVGDYSKVYADIKYDVYDITVYACEGIDDVYVDGVIMTKTIMANLFEASVTAGEHTISYTLTNGYSGTATMYIDDEAVSGLKFTAEGDFSTASDSTEYEIKLQGIEKSGYVPESPDVPAPVEPTEDEGLGITEYLLIVLVVLAAILVVVVAIRMMRS